MSFYLTGERVSVGRDFSNHIQIADSKSSRHHAEIRMEESGWVVWDLGSSNGTYVNRSQVKSHPLEPGDEIRIGEIILVFVADDEPAPPRLEREAATDESERYETLVDRSNPLLTGEFARDASDVDSLDDLRRANDRLLKLYELARTGAGADTLDELFRGIGGVIESALEADRVFGILLDGKARWTPLGRPSGAAGPGRVAKALADTPVSMTVVETVRREGQAVLSRAGEDSRFRDRPSVKLNEIGSVLCVPLAARGEFLGVLYADRLAGGEDFERSDLEFLDAAAAHLGVAVEALKAREAMGRRAEALARVVRSEHAVTIVGESEPMGRVAEFIEKAAPVDAGVLVLGESGTGKELVARALHYSSRRADDPFEVVNCAALSEALVESELFGHVKGAYTGASADRPGRFELADKGTIFLDEVGELPESMQTKLLRVLEQGESVRVGDARVRLVDVRVIAATNRDIDEEVSKGRFRQDLYYRLNVLRVELPPLRKRGGDIDLLIDHYLKLFAEKTGRARLALSRDVRRAFGDYSWPGNVRELKNALERLAVLAPKETIGMQDLPPGLLAAPLSKRQSAPSTSELSLADIEREHVLRVLDSVGGNKKRAAEVLAIDRSTLYAKLKAYGM
jgi:Nif-specific regulatory protein